MGRRNDGTCSAMEYSKGDNSLRRALGVPAKVAIQPLEKVWRAEIVTSRLH